MKKLLASLLVGGFIACGVPALAYQGIDDVCQNYWAQTEIAAVVSDSVMTLTDGNFNPEAQMSRVEFVKALLKVLGQENLEVTSKINFSDVAESSDIYAPIARSEALGLVYGYPNGTFQPNKAVLRDEAQSVISHITIDADVDSSIVSKFADADKVPAWANNVYAKTLSYGIYVNHPNENELRPTEELTRAEAAVLLYKLKKSLGVVKEEYVASETVVGVEHLDVTKKAECDEVKITNNGKVVLAKNIIKGYFYSDFSSKEANVGDTVTFTAKKDIYTEEGTLVIPAATTMKAVITSIEEKKWWNKNDKVMVEFETMTFPTGVTVPFKAEVLNNNGILTENRWAKPLAYTVGGAAVGAGAGAGIAAASCHDHYDNGFAIGIPVGAGLGLLTGLTTKGRTYKADENDYLWLELTQDLSIPN
jgi:hypothetical protein